jgi:hypothetical protein
MMVHHHKTKIPGQLFTIPQKDFKSTINNNKTSPVPKSESGNTGPTAPVKAAQNKYSTKQGTNIHQGIEV